MKLKRHYFETKVMLGLRDLRVLSKCGSNKVLGAGLSVKNPH